MAKVEMYSKDNCAYCVRAKQLLEKKGVEYTEYRVDLDNAKLEEMLKRSEGKRSIPQIFIDDDSIGGSDDLFALDAKGELDNLLK